MAKAKGTSLFSVGDVITSREGFKYKVLDYEDAHNVTIQWEDCGTIQICMSGDVAKGKLKYLNKRSVFGIGYLGFGRFVPGERRMSEGQERVPSAIHRHWRHVLERTVADRDINRYEDCEIVESWHCFQDFAEWAVEQKNAFGVEESGRLYHLDKDMVKEGNRLYCPEYCVFLPNEVNCFYTKKEIGNTGFAGVNYIRPGSKNAKDGYIARCHRGKVREYLGYYDTPEEAHAAYKIHKEKYAKELAAKWAGKIDDRVIEYLENFRVKN